MTKILIAEDDPLIGSLLERGLQANGYATFLADDGDRAGQMSLTGQFDLMILDMGLPEREGFHVLQELRSRGNRLPVLVLTGRGERDAAACLEAGADDYMRKPFQFAELLARVRTRLRASAPDDADRLSAGGLTLDLYARQASIGSETIGLTTREAALIEQFLRHPDEVLSRERLLSTVWGFSFDPTTNLVDVYVLALRRKLGADVIQTVRGAGYRLRAS